LRLRTGDCGPPTSSWIARDWLRAQEPGQTLQPGQIYDSNRILLSTLVSEAGALPKVLSLVPDTFEDTRQALVNAFEACDVVVSSGGVSVGEMDFVKRAFEEKGGLLQFWKVAIKPGRPFVFGRAGKNCFFGLPAIQFLRLLRSCCSFRPALLRWQGAREVQFEEAARSAGRAPDESR